MTRWFVVYTQPNGEARALENLRRQGFEAYLPSYLRRRSHARRVDTVRRPLFPRYLFVALDPELSRWRSVLGTIGVSDIVRNGDLPAPMPVGLVEALRSDADAGCFDDINLVARLRAGDEVRIVSGPFSDLSARFLSLGDAGRVFLLLDLMGGQVRASIPVREIAAA